MIDTLMVAATAAGKVLLKYFQKDLNITIKTSHKDFYTEADIEAQKTVKETIIRELAKKKIPASEIGFIGEENLFRPGQKHLFVMDPLDGTSNFSSGLDQFTVSIAYFADGVLQAGVIYQPTNKTFYWATKDKGAYKNGKRLKMVYKPLKQSFLEGSISSRPHIYPRLFKIYEKIFPQVKAFRSQFCVSLSGCYLAENKFNISVNGHTYIWDIAAMKLIIEEAGGITFDFKGKPLEIDPENPAKEYETVSCHPGLKNEVLKFF
jgi:myo-inositol-1(or 4)-monophosphatase